MSPETVPQRRKYVFKEYDPIFSKLFKKEKTRLQSILGPKPIIEHVGSTAVPGLGGKNIIDIYIAVPRNKMNETSKKLVEKGGYEFRPKGGNKERLFHQQDLPDPKEGIRRYHIHVTFPESKEWTSALAFRDYLRSHPAKARRYAAVKQLAAKQANEDKEKYQAIKGAILEEIKKRAVKLLRQDPI